MALGLVFFGASADGVGAARFLQPGNGVGCVDAGDGQQITLRTQNGVQTAAPTSGQTVTVAANITLLVLQPAGLLAALTVAFPSSPYDGQPFMMFCSQIVTTLSLTGATILGTALTALAVNGCQQFIYSDSLSKWVRIQ